MGKPLKTLGPLQRKIARIQLNSPRAKYREIAAACNCSTGQVFNSVNDPLYLAHMEELQDKADFRAAGHGQKLVKASYQAARELIDAVTPGSPTYDLLTPPERLKAAIELLDRCAETAKVKRYESSISNVAVDVDEIKRRASQYMGIIESKPGDDSRNSDPVN